MRRVQPIVDAIDTHIKALRKEVADLEGHRKRLLSNIGGSSHFGDQPLSFLFLFFFFSFCCCCCCFPFLITPSSTLYVSYSTYLESSATIWVCNYDATL